MTALRSRPPVATALVLSLLLAGMPAATGSGFPEAPPAAEVVGGIPMAAVGCIGCVAGIGFLAYSGGWGAFLAAGARSGSAMAILGCAGFCYRALKT